MDCPVCGADNPAGKRFCGDCGSPLIVVCAACGSENPPGQRFCGDCGKPLAPSSIAPPVTSVVSEPTQPVSFVGGRYEAVRFLGEGGKKRVYLCHDTKLDRDVAFALIKADGLDEEDHARIQREAQAMGRLGDHPHIVPVHDIGDEGGQPYLVSQLMGGGDVEGLIEKVEDHRLPLEQAISIANQVCQALEHAHSHGIVHRDLKPGNVWLTANGTAKLGDFGLAVATDRTRFTQAGMMVGTVAYMPPEQATGGEVTPRSDLYSLGCMLYEMVCGRTPFVGDESVAIIGQHLNTPPVAPTWHRPDCPPGLEALILRLLEKDPTKRPESAAEVGQGLDAVDLDAARPSLPLSEGASKGQMDNPLYRRTFVGRENELQQLRAGFDAAASGQGTLVMVVGEPGIGKTALIEQVATYTALRGGKALVGHCYEEGSLSLPYLPFIEALRSYVLTREPDRLRDELGSGAADVARIISEVRDRVQVELRPTGDPEDDRWRLFQAVTGFLRNAAAVQPILLVLEDLHWADRGTIDFLVHLARNLSGARLLIVGSYRDVEVDRAHPLSNALAELRRSGPLPRVLLRGLTVDEVHRMINALQGQEVRWSLAEAVHRQTEGSPLFIQEVLRYLVEEGLILRREGRWEGRWRSTGEGPPELSIPEGLRDVIGKRLSRLSPECNRLLTVAAFIGREFRLDVLGRVSRMAEDEAVAALEEGLKVGVLEERAAVGDVVYRFSHAYFRQTLYEELSAARRIRLHQDVARALEEVHARRLDDHAPELAEHFSHSSDAADLAKAVHYGELGARKAVAVFAHGEAVRLLERALEVQEVLDPDDKARRCDLLLLLGDALMATGEPQRVAESIAPEVLALAEDLDDGIRASTACRMALTALERYGGATVWGTEEFRGWAENADRWALPGTLDRIHADVAMHYGGGARRDLPYAATALDLARQLGTPAALLQGTRPALDGFAPLGEEDRYRAAREVAASAREGVDLFTLARSLYVSGVALWNHGDRDGAEALWGELDDLGTRTRDTYVLLRGPFLATVRAILDGRLEEALSATKDLRDRADELGSAAFGRQWGALLSARPLLYLGRTEELMHDLSNLPASAVPGQVQGRNLLCLADTGRANECRQGIDRLLGNLEEGEARGRDQWIFALEAAVLIADADHALPLAGRLADVVPPDYLGNPEQSCISVGRVLGAAAALAGQMDQAEDYSRQAIAACERARFRPELALTRLQLAEVLAAKADSLQQSAVGRSSPPRRDPKRKAGELMADDVRDEAFACLDFAIDEFREMKMQPALERALRHKGLLKA